MKRFTITVLFLAGVILAGCSRARQEPQPEAVKLAPAPKPASVQASANALAPPPSPASASGQGADPVSAHALTASEEQIVEELQAALEKYYLANVGSATRFSAPRRLDELVQRGVLRKLPAPPPGRKIVYHPETWQVTIERAD